MPTPIGMFRFGGGAARRQSEISVIQSFRVERNWLLRRGYGVSVDHELHLSVPEPILSKKWGGTTNAPPSIVKLASMRSAAFATRGRRWRRRGRIAVRTGAGYRNRAPVRAALDVGDARWRRRSISWRRRRRRGTRAKVVSDARQEAVRRKASRSGSRVGGIIGDELVGEAKLSSLEVAVLQTQFDVAADGCTSARDQLPGEFGFADAVSAAAELDSCEAGAGTGIHAEIGPAEVDQSVHHA